jgi:hypothetical protein
LAESIGDALASGCTDYVAAGSVCLFLLLSAWLVIVVILFKGLREKSAIFEPAQGTLSGRMKQALNAKGETWYGSLMAKRDAVNEMWICGEWQDPHEKAPVCK